MKGKELSTEQAPAVQEKGGAGCKSGTEATHIELNNNPRSALSGRERKGETITQGESDEEHLNMEEN